MKGQMEHFKHISSGTSIIPLDNLRTPIVAVVAQLAQIGFRILIRQDRDGYISVKHTAPAGADDSELALCKLLLKAIDGLPVDKLICVGGGA